MRGFWFGIFSVLYLFIHGSAAGNDVQDPVCTPIVPQFPIADRPELKTWWHRQCEIAEDNPNAPVLLHQVRRSTSYHVQVSLPSDPGQRFHAFTYMSIPRNGMPAYAGRADGAEFASAAGLTMSWSSFIYSQDVYVYVQRYKQTNLTAEQVTIRPTHLNLEKTAVDSRTIRIRVPYRPGGLRFSVEFADELYWSYQAGGSAAGTLTLNEGRQVHQEPRNALMIFAEPSNEDRAAELVPNLSSKSVFVPSNGIINLSQLTEAHNTIYFPPGVYSLRWNTHEYLPPHIQWIYLAPGAYVKGAFEFQGERTDYKVTGYGVLSGENYEYEPDRRNSYNRTIDRECHGSCVKMLQFKAASFHQQLLVHGITIANPPYHSFVVYDEASDFKMTVQSFKQVGAWYWQTDGLELYRGGRMEHAFIHSNDDVLKIYHSDLKIEDVVVWKGENGPVVQLGWVPRAMESVHVKDVFVIHNRMYWQDIKHNHCIINAARHYEMSGAEDTANSTFWIRNILLENIHSEGMNLCAMRLFALSNWENIHIKGLYIESWNQLPVRSQQNQFHCLKDVNGASVSIGNELKDSRGLKIENYWVGDQKVSKWNDSWRAEQLGRLNFDPELWDHWNAW